MHAAGADQGNVRYRGATTRVRNVGAPLQSFLRTSNGSAAVLGVAILVALVWANSPWWHTYEAIWRTEMSFRLGNMAVTLDLRHWINQGLMTLFFLVVGLEAKRELDIGELRERKQLTVPVLAAIGGAVVPVLIFLSLNAGGPGAAGWGVAMSTDTAFMLGAVAVLAPRATRLRLFLLTLAVVDDLIALVIIATVYTGDLHPVPLALALALFAAIVGLRYAPAPTRHALATLTGIALWVALLESGIDPVIAGLGVGLIVSAYPPERARLERVVELARTFREQPTPELARSARRGVADAISPNERLQQQFQPLVGYVIVPLFALANAGVHLTAELLGDALRSPITLGIVAGYVVGKPVGILGATWVAKRLQPGSRRLPVSWPVLAAGAVVSGIGFTVSLLVASIAFRGPALDQAKVGVLTAAILATAATWVVVRAIAALPDAVRARQISGTADLLVDLADDVDPARDHMRGSVRATVTLVEYGDYECPYCGQAETVVRELLSSFGDDLRYVWRHLPLADVHPHAQAAAEAAEAAAERGEFWAMHDALMAAEGDLAPDALGRYAGALGLDPERLVTDLARHTRAARVTEDVESADRSGVSGTPTFFVNGRRHRGAYDVATLAQAVRSARSRERAKRAAASEPPRG